MSRINSWLDRLPRESIHLTGAESPAFRAIGVSGFHLALATVIGGALLRGLPIAVAVVIALTAAASFFGWGLLRRALTGKETLVLFEYVWIAGAAVAAALVMLGAPLLTWFDVLAVALSVFLAAGRIGCAVAGCCHGHPSSLGIRYPEDHPVSRVAGLRLFPVTLIECAGLLVIGATGLAALPVAAPGAVLVWAMAAYAILRFGMESLRGDPRPHIIGVPVARLAAGAQLTAALVIDTALHHDPRDSIAAAVAMLGLVAAGLTGQIWYRRRPRPVTADHVAQIRTSLVRARAGQTPVTDGMQPAVSSLPGGVTIATTTEPNGVHLSVGGESVSLTARRRLAAAATGGDSPAIIGPRGVVHVFASSNDVPSPHSQNPAGNRQLAPTAGSRADSHATPFTLPLWTTSGSRNQTTVKGRPPNQEVLPTH
jgi:hypothetical protein